MTAPVLVYQRDASWYDHPDTSSWPKRFHRPSSVPGAECMAACAPTRIMLDDETGKPSTRVLPTMLCRRCFDRNGSPRNDVITSLPNDVDACG